LVGNTLESYTESFKIIYHDWFYRIEMSRNVWLAESWFGSHSEMYCHCLVPCASDKVWGDRSYLTSDAHVCDVGFII